MNVTGEKEQKVERQVKRKAENLQDAEHFTTPSKKLKSTKTPKRAPQKTQAEVNPVKQFLNKFNFKKPKPSLSTIPSPPENLHTTPVIDEDKDDPPAQKSANETFMSRFSQAKSIFEEKRSSSSSSPKCRKKCKKSTKVTKQCTTPKIITSWKKTSDSPTIFKDKIRSYL